MIENGKSVDLHAGPSSAPARSRAVGNAVVGTKPNIVFGGSPRRCPDRFLSSLRRLDARDHETRVSKSNLNGRIGGVSCSLGCDGIAADFVRGVLHCAMVCMTAGIDDSPGEVESQGTCAFHRGVQGDPIRTAADVGDVSGDVESAPMRSIARDDGQGEIDHAPICTREIRAPDDGRRGEPARSEVAAQRILGHYAIEVRPRRIECAQAVDQRLRLRANRGCDSPFDRIAAYGSKRAGDARLPRMIFALAQCDVGAAGHLQWIVIAHRAWSTAVLQARTCRRDIDMANIASNWDSLRHAPGPPLKERARPRHYSPTRLRQSHGRWTPKQQSAAAENV